MPPTIFLLVWLTLWAHGRRALRQILAFHLPSGSRMLNSGRRPLGHLHWRCPSQIFPTLQVFSFLRYPSLFIFIVLTLGNIQLAHPMDSPLGCLLKNLKALGLINLNPKRWIFYCNIAWPQHKWGGGTSGSLNSNAILQLDLHCHSLDSLLRFSSQEETIF